MRKLHINKLEYRITALEGDKKIKYGATIPFNETLSIIWGPNSVGKSSIITGILYGLGAEESLGIFKNNQNPFKPEFYDKIQNKKIVRSYLLLEISNGSEEITIARSLLDNKLEERSKNIAVVRYCKIENFNN